MKGWLQGAGISPESSWHFGFAAAAVGMFLGLVQYVLGDRAMGTAGKHPVPAESPEAAARNRRTLLYTVIAVFGIPALFAALGFSGVVTFTTQSLTIVTLVALVTVLVGFFAAMFLFGTWSPDEKKRLLVIMLLCLGATIFFADFEQAGSTLNLFAERHTSTSFLGFDFPASWLQSANALFIIILAPVFGFIWTALGRRGKNPASPAKFAIGMLVMALSFIWMLPPAGTAEAGGRSGPGWLLMLYLLHTIAELCISPVGLSSMTKLAPARIAGMVMGMWFAAIALGNYLSGAAAGVTESLGMTTFFLVIATPPAVAALLFAVLNKPIHRMLGDMKVKH
jgi:POT family proton-dependent oligopeptide transporter